MTSGVLGVGRQTALAGSPLTPALSRKDLRSASEGAGGRRSLELVGLDVVLVAFEEVDDVVGGAHALAFDGFVGAGADVGGDDDVFDFLEDVGGFHRFGFED